METGSTQDFSIEPLKPLPMPIARGMSDRQDSLKSLRRIKSTTAVMGTRTLIWVGLR